MVGRVANCPNCGGGVEFKAGTSLLTVCPYCSSTVARVGADITQLEITGRVAPLADVASPLSVGTRGEFRQRTFTLLGRAQYDHGAGPWNEWYAAFDDGRWGWVAEAQGRVIISFEATQDDLPSFTEADVGTHFWLSDHRFTVVERREAKMVSAEGELPFPVRPDSSFRYCDLQGPGRAFATFDFGDGDAVEHLFLGEALDYEDAFDASQLSGGASREAQALGLNCPHCGAGFELQAPDTSMRVTCVRCDSLLDCSQGSELFLLQSAQPPARPARVPLGSQGEMRGNRYTVLGHLVRSVTYEGIRFGWDEYLLHSRDVGYRWLVDSNGHWTFVEPLGAGDVIEVGSGIRVRDETFKHFTSAAARVEALRGEFYWKVQVGETVTAVDYVKPPCVVSQERSTEEVNWSLGTYVEPESIQKAFSVDEQWPKPRGVAPAQPNPHRPSLKSMMRSAFVFTGALILCALVLAVLQPGWTVVDAGFRMDPAKREVVSTEPFELSRRGNLGIRATAPVDNSWVYLEGQLVHLDTNEVTPFGVEVSYYSGVSGGERWSEGSRSRTVFLGEVVPGRYVMKLTPQGAPGRRGALDVKVTARSRVFLPSHALLVLFFLWMLPLLGGAIYLGFEKRRWAESDHAE